MDKDKMIYELWKLLDDIDTASDMFKSHYKELAEYTYNKQRKRHTVVPEKYLDELYGKYYKDETGIIDKKVD